MIGRRIDRVRASVSRLRGFMRVTGYYSSCKQKGVLRGVERGANTVSETPPSVLSEALLSHQLVSDIYTTN